MSQSRNRIATWLVYAVISLLASCATQPPTIESGQQSAVRARAKAHTDLGAAYFQQKKYDIALEEFTLAANIDPNFGFAYNGLGMVNAALKQDEAADKYFKRAIQIAPNNSEAHNNYGNFLCSRGRYNESVKEYLVAVKNPLYATPDAAYTNAGICSKRAGDLESAKKYFNQAITVKPFSEGATYELALLQFEQKDAALAYQNLQHLLQTRPSARVLYLGVQLAKVLGDREAEKEYSLQLFKRYPNAKQTAALRTERQAQ